MTSSKKCFKCGIEKPMDEFYRHPSMADGRLGKCKQCTKTDVAEHRSANIEKIRAYDRDRGKIPERAKAAAQISKLWTQADKRRSKCHNAVTRAVRKGELIRQPCERCACVKSYAHHESYDHPLVVVWLCQPCHKQRHKEMVIAGIDP